MKLGLTILTWLGVFWLGLITLVVVVPVVVAGGVLLWEWLHRRRRAKAQAGKERP